MGESPSDGSEGDTSPEGACPRRIQKGRTRGVERPLDKARKPWRNKAGWRAEAKSGRLRDVLHKSLKPGEENAPA